MMVSDNRQLTWAIMANTTLLSVEEMYRADALATKGGVTGIELMEAAGRAVFNAIEGRWDKQPVAILCGPGNNGGDGFVIARLLKEAGWPVRLSLLGDRRALKGNAAFNAGLWEGETEPLSLESLDGLKLVVDALFGAGLARPVDGIARDVIEAINERELDCVAVDIPSGVHGDTGQAMGVAPRAQVTVTFFCGKPGHWLLPGREFRGDLQIADIGIPETVLGDIQPRTYLNDPSLWLAALPKHELTDNKYQRGHAVIIGGAEMTGAARLAARAARRMGAGLVTITTPPEAFTIYAAEEAGTLIKSVEDQAAFADFLSDPRLNAVLIGPGAGVEKGTRDKVLTVLGMEKASVLDADAITVFSDDPAALFSAIRSPCVLTPHEGEFGRIFPDVTGGKLERTREAAKRSGATVLLKGADTVIARPDGEAAINANAPAELATAGSGDVLAGIILGLMAQSLDAFDAARAAAWIHGAAGASAGTGLIAEDLPDALPQVLSGI